MFDLVADVERYPEFVPLCQALKIRQRTPKPDGTEIVIADMTVSFKLVREGFTEGAGNAGRSMHPQPRVQNRKAHELVTTGSPKSPPAFPARMVLTVSFVLAPETGLCCLRRPENALASSPT
jgi:hypothetical protein